MNFSEYGDKKRNRPLVSFEVFPPKDDAEFEKLKRSLGELAELSPDMITVTHGAMGGGRKQNLEVASYVKNSLGVESACHLTCIGYSKREIDLMLERMEGEGISNVVALRGDIPKENGQGLLSRGAFSHANELVEHIRSREKEKSRRFSVAVAGYPEKHLEAPSFEEDVENLAKKVRAGADAIITQLFFDNRHYFDFVERVKDAGIDVPVIPGLMPVLSSRQVIRISSLCGAKIPEPLERKLRDAGDDNARAREIGIAQCVEQASELVERGVPGIHFYVLNKTSHIRKILESI